MSNFGFNLLSVTQSVIGRQAYQYVQWLGTTTNEFGYEVDSFADPVDREGGIYPISRESMQKAGLDHDKEYIQVFDTELIELMTDSSNADRLIFNGYRWRPTKTPNSWQPSGGWGQVIAVKEGKVIV